MNKDENETSDPKVMKINELQEALCEVLNEQKSTVEIASTALIMLVISSLRCIGQFNKVEYLEFCLKYWDKSSEIEERDSCP